MIDAKELKRLAGGRWVETLSATAGLDAGLLDGKPHPCPKCGGEDRFRLIDADAGALYCNKCFSEKNGDGLAAIQWLTGCSFPEALKMVAEYLGIDQGNNRSPGKAKASDKAKRLAENIKKMALPEN